MSDGSSFSVLATTLGQLQPHSIAISSKRGPSMVRPLHQQLQIDHPPLLMCICGSPGKTEFLPGCSPR